MALKISVFKANTKEEAIKIVDKAFHWYAHTNAKQPEKISVTLNATGEFEKDVKRHIKKINKNPQVHIKFFKLYNSGQS